MGLIDTLSAVSPREPPGSPLGHIENMRDKQSHETATAGVAPNVPVTATIPELQSTAIGTIAQDTLAVAVAAKMPEVIRDKDLNQIGSDVARIGAMTAALQDEGLQGKLKKSQAERLMGDATADVIDSMVRVHKSKEEKESTLYNRYEYVFGMLGISKQLPGFMCVVVLVIYAVIGTALMITCGTLFFIVNFIIDGVRGIFTRLTALFRATQGLAKGLAVTAVFVLILGLIGIGAYLIIKWTL